MVQINGSRALWLVLMGEKGWSFSKSCGKSLVEEQEMWSEKKEVINTQ
jgi:hypothetical protein